MRRESGFTGNIDWLMVFFYLGFVILGWINIYAATYDPEAQSSIFDFNTSAGQQLIWIGLSSVLIMLIMVIDHKFFHSFAFIIYGFFILLLIVTLFVAPDIKGSRSWMVIGPVRFQPAEFTKFATALALAAFLGDHLAKWQQLKTKLIAFIIILAPPIIIMLQNETGTALVYLAFIIVLYREGLSNWIPLLGIIAVTVFILTLSFGKTTMIASYTIISVIVIITILITELSSKLPSFKRYMKKLGIILTVATVFGLTSFSVDYFVHDILKPHQRDRIFVLIDQTADSQDKGYNLRQSKIAISAGEFLGKGFLQGTQTKLKYVPEQHTDFIFCTIGEEHGWLGSSLVIVLYVLFLFRLIFLAERQKDNFARIYGYSVASIFFIHLMINIGMTIGLFPIIGIPLPFFSYGGSSVLGFTILLFIFIKLDAHRKQVLWH